MGWCFVRARRDLWKFSKTSNTSSLDVLPLPTQALGEMDLDALGVLSLIDRQSAA